MGCRQGAPARSTHPGSAGAAAPGRAPRRRAAAVGATGRGGQAAALAAPHAVRCWRRTAVLPYKPVRQVLPFIPATSPPSQRRRPAYACTKLVPACLPAGPI